jgi:V/A-type H+-transporting ATPase subunit I
MIVAMKKTGIVVLAGEAPRALARLRALGVVHVEHQQPPQGAEVAGLRDEAALFQSALDVFGEADFAPFIGPAAAEMSKDCRSVARHVLDTRKRYDQVREHAHNLSARLSLWDPWGDFDPEDIRRLGEKNIFVRLYQVPASALGEAASKALVLPLFERAGLVSCAVLSREPADIGYPEVALPKHSLSQKRARLAEDEKVIKTLREEILKAARFRDCLKAAKAAAIGELEFHEALRGMGEAGTLAYLVGYVPADRVGLLTQAAQKEGWGLWITDPAEEDLVPTLVRNPAWASLIRPVLRLLEIVPGYRELDISPLFLIFFSLFFGMLIGDAGYGLVYLGLTALAHKKMGRGAKDRTLFFLLYLLSGCAVVWGALTGTFFGQAWLMPTAVKPLVPVLTDAKFIQGLCFFIGAVHLTIAHLWRAAVLAPSQPALAELGWISVIWAAFFLARTLLLDAPFPAFGQPLIYLGVALVVFFINPKKNLFLRAASGLGSCVLSLMNNFTDVVSYVRLFAVGLATVAIADAFNEMAAGIAGGGPLALAGSILIVVAGHSLNIVLGPMSVLVHGVRLNVLEFSGHAAVTWSGFAYKPFSEDGARG